MKIVRRPKNKDDFCTLAPRFDFRDPEKIPWTSVEEDREEYCRRIGEEFWNNEGL
jgi:hypothetical protein